MNRKNISEIKDVGEAMMDNIEYYKYSSIRPRFVRLLELRESDAFIGEEKTLQGTLKQISLDSCSEPFDAISYACGPAVYCECILIDGKKVLVTKNCHNALRHLRDQFGLRTVWVDAVCINERNDDEKSGQIRLMTSIYGKARKVYIWLGEHSEDSAADRALDWLQDISVYQLPLLGVRLSNFPKNMHPWEVIKLFGIIPDVIRASE
jgi:Heterokaryon incompatibility protein (HET)